MIIAPASAQVIPVLITGRLSHFLINDLRGGVCDPETANARGRGHSRGCVPSDFSSSLHGDSSSPKGQHDHVSQ